MKKILDKNPRFWDNAQLIMMILPAIVLLIVFAYLPMGGIVLAFKDYKVTQGIWGSAWSDPWYKNFLFLLKSNDLFRILRNTIGLNTLFIFTGLIASVSFALCMYEVKKPRHVKLYQTVSILPYFLSWVAVAFMVYGFLRHEGGLLNKLICALGGEEIKWYSKPNYWPAILAITNIWKGVGIGSIIYYATLLNTDQALYEAATVDGAYIATGIGADNNNQYDIVRWWHFPI